MRPRAKAKRKPKPGPRLRPTVWVGSSKEDLQGMPVEVQRTMGTALMWAQADGIDPEGEYMGLHDSARPMVGSHLRGVIEIADDHDGETYRAMYAAKLGEAIYVLRAFQKKSKRGRATPQRDLDLIVKRLKEARAIEAEKKEGGR